MDNITDDKINSVDYTSYQPRYSEKETFEDMHERLLGKYIERCYKSTNDVIEYIQPNIVNIMKMSNVLNSDTKYVFITKCGGIEQISHEIPTYKKVVGKLFGDKYIKV